MRIIIDPTFKDVEIFVEKNVQRVFDNIFEKYVLHGGGAREVKVIREYTPMHMAIVIVDDGKDICTNSKDVRPFWDHTYYKDLGLVISEEILSVTDITLRERDGGGRGTVFASDVLRVDTRVGNDIAFSVV